MQGGIVMTWKKILSVPLLLLSVAILAACTTADAATPTDNMLPIVEDPYEVIADGRLMPVRHVAMSFVNGGLIGEVYVIEGQTVREGEPLARLSNQERYKAEVAAAQLELTNASQALQELLDQTGLAQAEASLELAQAKDALREAEYKWNVQQEGNRASQALIDEAKAKLRLSESRMDRAKDYYDQYSGRDSEDLERALALQQYSAARQSYDSAVRSYNWYTGKPTELQQALLDAELAMAQARVNEAERQWEKVKDGPNPDELKLAQERVELAEASLQAAEAALAEAELVAPFAGTVASIDLKPGEQAGPGQVGVVIADFDSWVIETENLTEIELPKVSQGQNVEITFDSIPELALQGSVESISPYYEILRGDVTYQVQVALDEFDPRLQWGMTAVVTFQK